MKIMINHLSFENSESSSTQVNFEYVVKGFAESLKLLYLKYSIHDVQLTGVIDNIKDVKLYNNVDLINIVRRCQDSDAKNLVLAKLVNYVNLSQFGTGISVEFSISLFTCEKWKEIITPLAEEYDNIKNIPCLLTGNLNAILLRLVILKDLLLVDESDLINKKYVNSFYLGDFEREFLELSRSSNEEKRSVIHTLSKIICELSGLSLNMDLSKKNKREIYQNQKGSVLLSTDYLHGTFEVYDSKGIHQSEINFKGEILEEGDKSGRHNINVT